MNHIYMYTCDCAQFASVARGTLFPRGPGGNSSSNKTKTKNHGGGEGTNMGGAEKINPQLTSLARSVNLSTDLKMHCLDQRHGGGGGGGQNVDGGNQRRGEDAVVSMGGVHGFQHVEGVSGVWRKVKEDSDPMDEACDMVALPWVLRRALRFLNVLKIEDTADSFVTVLKAGGLMDVVERYPKNGTKVKHSRRDKRRGHHIGSVVYEDGHPQILVEWDDPYGGVCRDTFILSDDGTELVQVTRMEIRGSRRKTEYKTKYKRKYQ